MSTLIKQLWRCINCGAERVWGSSVVADPNVKAYLLCDSCGRHMKHTFVEHTFKEL